MVSRSGNIQKLSGIEKIKLENVKLREEVNNIKKTENLYKDKIRDLETENATLKDENERLKRGT